jgi:hypothetical protein
MIAIPLHTVKYALLEKPSGGGRGWADKGQRRVVLELLTERRYKGKTDFPASVWDFRSLLWGHQSLKC